MQDLDTTRNSAICGFRIELFPRSTSKTAHGEPRTRRDGKRLEQSLGATILSQSASSSDASRRGARFRAEVQPESISRQLTALRAFYGLKANARTRILERRLAGSYHPWLIFLACGLVLLGCVLQTPSLALTTLMAANLNPRRQLFARPLRNIANCSTLNTNTTVAFNMIFLDCKTEMKAIFDL